MRVKSFLISLLISLAAGALCQVPAQIKNKAEDELIARQRAYFEAIVKKDYAALDNLLADDYVGGYAAGIIDKTRENKDLREFPLTKFQMSEIKTRFPDKKTGLIVFKLSVTVVYDGKEFSEDDILNCLWTRRGREWRLAAQTAVKFVKGT